ncbi:uncharacterized protein LOC125655172 isoform X2 [Ostrea edulis]|nr:uncharacterized protein LOC125655172 isoform X2 [Ostrea edulis]
MASKHIRHLQNLNNFHGGHMENFQVDGAGRACCEDKFYMGFKECQDEVMRYYVEFEGRDIKDPVCVNVDKHLEQASQKFLPKEHSRSGKSDDIIIEDTNSFQSTNNMMHEPPVDLPRQAPEEAPVNSQDRFLRNLLLPKEPSFNSMSSSNSSYNGSNASGESYLYPISMRNADGPQMAFREDTEGSYSLSSHSTEKPNHSTDSDRDSSTGGSVKENHAYKLKHNIIKRFSQEEKREHHHLVPPSSDTSSSSSREDEKEKVKRKYPRHKLRPHSESSSIHSNSSKSDLQSSNIPLPAFVLNPDGTHYLPVCIHPSFLGNVFPNKELGKNSIYHPISIPVNFDGPYIAMPHSPISQPCGTLESSCNRDIMPGIPEVVN